MLTRKKNPLTLPYSPEKEEHWDRLWISYFKREPNQQLSLQKDVRREDLPASRQAMVDDPTLFLGCGADELRGKTVLEVGCGAGYLPKLIAHHTKLYVGVDWSGLALLVAKRTCPTNTRFVHATELDALRDLVGRVDAVVCRHFVIHQNLERLADLLRFEAELLRPGGKVFADFWLDNPALHDGGGVFPAETNPDVANAVFRFSDEQVRQVARESGLSVVDDHPRPDVLRRFVTYEKA